MYMKRALQSGMSVEQVHQHTRIDPFFLHNIREIVEAERRAAADAELVSES